MMRERFEVYEIMISALDLRKDCPSKWIGNPWGEPTEPALQSKHRV